MKHLLIAASLSVSSLVSSAALAQVEVVAPQIRFEVTPPLVVVSPGIQVVEDYDDEVFFTSGFYWVRRDGHWFKAKGHDGGWVLVGPKLVPAGLVRLTPGRYRHWKPAKAVFKSGGGSKGNGGFFKPGKGGGGGGGKHGGGHGKH